MRNLAKPRALVGGEAYKEGERLLELRDLLFGKGVGLFPALLSAIKVADLKAARPSALSAAGFPRKLEAGEETDHVGLCIEEVRKCSVGGSAGWGCRRLRGLSYACLAVVAGGG